MTQCHQICISCELRRVVLDYVNLEREDSLGLQRWSGNQLYTLRRAALSALHIVAPLCPQVLLQIMKGAAF